jgi:hypothetical protein
MFAMTTGNRDLALEPTRQQHPSALRPPDVAVRQPASQ